ncbi:phenylacetic acid degradation bifunctional protein PaaZ [Falsarthrobacter nasiphocae]|uniref:Oxepin-CoA hydrolase/3-oxo-5,6-dehydrosuberyl-CoA semialdehyde dehydrogenase n=1 Tax=Falsarthrobacter nasiphocae TaxID=189863 RepID=A0AAE3YIJ0_9MICC|nr:phenylacetic acid degradation bifunctional protein PaaZ [Falsarthrobacter nasiphocae]MDR6892396.1 oxepin-CoA hydrolase/3-oxo-5,6-dehydrosuberyl-CoA semialdehyde dehydrogenase [Falsarthrobacter nasiphocae]
MSVTTPALLPSFLSGSWTNPSDAAQDGVAELRDASTGAVVGLMPKASADLASAFEYARTAGRDSLGDLTFHERALRLKALAQHLTANKDRLYELSAKTGATRIDSMVDVDGGIGVLFTMASKGRRELPNATVIPDGPTEVLSKDGSFIGEHVYSRIPGVAVQINAFNFPVWGMLEKLAPAFLAGVPTIAKPATPSSYLAVECVKIMDESGLLPEGSLQIVAGGARDILEHIDYRDMVSFTGSAGTAAKLRTEALARNARFTSEADSLNAAILGRDVEEGSAEFSAFVRAVVTEMTVKAGQKCTAIRRVIVPHAMVEPVQKAVAARIAEKTVVGDPRTEGTTMGALVSEDQLRDVREAVSRLEAAGGRNVLDPLPVPEGGAFMSPVLLVWEDAEATELHEVEAFGPVTSVLGYETDDDAVRLAARGAGSLVATVCTADPKTAARLTLGIAGHHGRVHILNAETARSSTGHGSPVPHLVHGGPGRAGGGEELGGIRSVKHHMQRSAIQGSPNMLTAVTGQWHRGAERRISGEPEFGGSPELEHPFRKSLAELEIGDAFVSALRTVRREDIQAFAEETGDTFYAHTNEEAAAANPFFPGIVAHGYLLVSWAAGLFVSPEPGPVLANYGLENLRFITPVAAGDSIRVELTAKRITPRETDEYGEVAWDALLVNQDGETVATYDVLTLVAKTR